MRFKIFEDGFNLYQAGQVKLINMTDRTAIFEVDGVDVRAELRSSQLRFHCGCTFHKKRMLQDKLCKRIIAALAFMRYQKKKVRLPIIVMADKIKGKLGVWLERKKEKSVMFNVNDIPVIIEKSQSGTKFICHCELHLPVEIQDKLCVEMLATIFWLYDKRGKVKK